MTVRIDLPSDIRLIDLLHGAAERMSELAGFDEDEGLNVGLAVREAAINAMKHGNGGNPALAVIVTMSVDDDALTATIRDHGPGFDADATPDPTAEANLLQTSGRGLLLIRAFVDEVVFRRAEDGDGMEIVMTKRRGGDAGDGASQ